MEKRPSPLQAGFMLTAQEKRCILVVCALFLLGLAARWFYLKNQKPEVYAPAEVENMEQSDE